MPKGERRPAVVSPEQRLYVEKVLQGVPMAQIARELGVHRQRLYEWEKMPHVARLMREAEREVSAAISARCAAGFWHAMELARQGIELYMQRVRENPDLAVDTSRFDAHLRLMAELHSKNLRRPEDEDDASAEVAAAERGKAILAEYSVDPEKKKEDPTE